MSAASDILSNYQHLVTNLTLVPATGGVYEVEVNDDLIYSKKATSRHAEPGEVLELFTNLVGTDTRRFGT